MASRTPRPVMIDDMDDAIRYTGGGWFLDNGSRDGFGDNGPTYMHTLHGTNVNGSLAYTFQGTSAQVFGTSLVAGTPAEPSWECFVDKTQIHGIDLLLTFGSSGNNWLLCNALDLADGQHEITVNVTAMGRPFWFDYILYNPSPSLSLETSVTVADNNDPSILLDSRWTTLENTTNMTQAAGSTATFHFIGTSVSWAGRIPTEFPHNASNATYSVDGGLPMSFPLNGLPLGAVFTAYNQILFTTPDLAAGPHRLVVVYHGSDTQTPLTLDYLYVNNTPTSITSSMSSSTSAKSSPTTLANPTPPPRKGRLPVGEIIGGVVAGLVLISLTLFFLWKYKRRLQHSNTYPGTGNVHAPLHVAVSPFTGHSASRVGWSISKVYRDILINPVSLDGLGPQMQRGAVTKPPHPSQPPLVPTRTTESAIGPQVWRGSLTEPLHPSPPPPVSATDQTQPTSVGTPQRAPSAGLLLIPELHAPVVNPIAQTTPMAQLSNPEEHTRVVHQDSGLRFSGTVISDVPPMYTEA